MRETLKFGLSSSCLIELMRGSHTIELEKDGPAPLGDEVVGIPYEDFLHEDEYNR
jgi:hypothetical protein